MNRQEFEAEILSALGGRISSDETILLSVGGSDYNLPRAWIKKAERMIARRHDFSVLETTVTSLTTTADTPTLAIPSGIKKTRALRIIDGTSSRKLIYKPVAWVDKHYPNPGADSNAKPSLYTVRGTNYEFVAVPDDTYTVYADVWMWPTEMSGDADVSDFGEDFVDDVIFHFAVAFGFAHYGEVYKKDADYHFSIGNALLTDAIRADRYDPDYEPTPDGFIVSQGNLANALDPGSVPSGTVNPWR